MSNYSCLLSFPILRKKNRSFCAKYNFCNKEHKNLLRYDICSRRYELLLSLAISYRPISSTNIAIPCPRWALGQENNVNNCTITYKQYLRQLSRAQKQIAPFACGNPFTRCNPRHQDRSSVTPLSEHCCLHGRTKASGRSEYITRVLRCMVGCI